jgi:hypothetical protein
MLPNWIFDLNLATFIWDWTFALCLVTLWFESGNPYFESGNHCFGLKICFESGNLWLGFGNQPLL